MLGSVGGWSRELFRGEWLVNGAFNQKAGPEAPLSRCLVYFMHYAARGQGHGLELEPELIQTCMIQKRCCGKKWAKVLVCLWGFACVLRLPPPVRYGPQCPSLLDFLSGCLVRVRWTCRSSTDPRTDHALS
jgi:hypothetical protein